MASDEDLDDAKLKAAIAASLKDLEKSGDEGDPAPAPSGRQKGVVDLTVESDGDEVVEVYPKSKSVVESESEDEGGEDAELKKAVEVSLRASEENDSGDDAELKRAIQMSLQGESGGGDNTSAHANLTQKKNDKTSSHSEQGKSMSKPEPSRMMPLLGLDRKQMEQERLARLAKRKAEEAPTNQPEAKQLRTEASSGGQGAKGPKIPSRTMSPRKEKSTSSDGQSKNKPDNPSTTPSVQFPTGVIKKTWNQHCPRNDDDIKIEEVFQAADLELAVLSSFMWDMEWIFSNLNTKSTRFLLVMQAKEESTVCCDPY